MMEDLVAADTGEVVLLKVNYQHALQLEGEVQSAVGYCILKRPGGFLLALPPTYIPQPVLEEASREGFLGILGPYTISVLIADFSEQAMAGIEVLEENIAQCVPFLEEAPNLFPLATALVAFAASWTAGVEGDRGAYFTAEEHGPPGPPLAPPRARVPVEEPFQLDVDGAPLAISGEGELTGDSQIANAVLAQSRALTALVAQLAGSSDPISDLPSGGGGSLSTKGSAARLRLQRELSARTGSFFDKVFEAALRRMEPTVDLNSLAGGTQQVPVMTRYLERYGGFRDHRTWGLVQWQLGQIFDLLSTDQVGGAKHAVALLMVMVDQLVLDSGSPDLGWILSLQEDPPGPLFSAPSNMLGSSLRSCSHLADPKWVATSLAYVKEMETLANRRAEVAKRPPPGPPEPPGSKASPLTRKQQRAKLWAERKAAAGAPPKA
eukprot:s400_g20.t1